MKLSKRAGALLLAAGAGVVAAPGLAAAADMTPGQVAAVEKELSTREVPFEIPLGGATDKLGVLPEGGKISGGIPTSLVMPPVPEEHAKHQLIPDHVVPAVNTSRVGPSLEAAVPLPAADRSAELGKLLLDAPAAPLHTAGPALTMGQPLSLVDGPDGRQDGDIAFGDLNPQVITAPVQAVPGAQATLGSPDKHISVTGAMEDLAATATGTTAEVLNATD
ncbi:hypothetical protein ABT095_28055 [Kitasatospora sp. NPDC002227]|uniref:hypothetical protein n=1 Tax=Kitasatospora sp. NPDC002227 TaxID=3154773 RepID=UPI003330D7CB